MSLIKKYNIPVPRYTSYPTVPFWEEMPTEEEWLDLVKENFIKTNHSKGISLYIHLPFCESLCTYCACNTRITVNHAVEKPYINALLQEWEIYLKTFTEKPNLREIHLGGGTPTFFAPENLRYLVSSILNSCQVDADADFSFEGHPSNTKKEHLETLYKLGFKRVSLGIQDFDLMVQEAINRYQSPEEVQEVVSLARDTGYTSVNFDLVYGLPFQTQEGFVNTIEKALKIKPDRLALYSYAHVPWLKPGQRKYTEQDLPADELKQQLYITAKQLLLENGYKEIGMDHFALESDALYKACLESKLHRNFMGYTIQQTELLIGLGASAISDCWNGFIQNIKTVEEYQASIGLGHLAIFKGHKLSEEDEILRKHILNIMCKGQTNWSKKDLQCDDLFFALDRLKELKKDSLIKMEGKTLVLTEEGKKYMRNVCLCFDARYWAKTPEKKIFSSAV